MKRISILMLLLIAMLPAARAADCDSDLIVVGYEIDWAELVIDIDNPTSSAQTGGLTLELVLNGQYHWWWIDGISVPANTEWEVTLGFPSTLNVLGVGVCEDKPTGIVDAPDPVASGAKQKDRKKKK